MFPAKWLAAIWMVLIASLLTTEARAQAWVQPKGGYYLKVSGNYLFTEGEFNHLGDEQPIFAEDPARLDTSFRDVSIITYLEYGLTDRFTMVMKIPFKILTSKETQNQGAGFPVRKVTRTNGGLADLELMLRLPILSGPSALSVQAGVKVPLGYEKDPDNDGPPLGTGEADGLLFFFFGQSLYPLPAYFQAGAGYRVRGGPLSDVYEFGAEAGYTLGNLFAKFRFQAWRSTITPPDLAGGTVMTPLPGGGGAVNEVIVGDKDEYKLMPTVEYRFTDRFALTGEIYHSVAGKNTTTGTTYSLGIVFSR